MQRSLLLLPIAALLAGHAFGQCATLSYSGAFNGQKGTTFEIRNLSTTPMTIGTFDQAFNGAGSADIEIYTIAGPCAGLELVASAWTLVGSALAVPHVGSPTFDPLPIAINITIPPSGTQSFYITCTNATPSGVYYTTGGTDYGNIYASNADLGLVARTGNSYPFASGFGLPTQGRLWNGRVNYCPAGGGTLFATSNSYGTGCVTRPDQSFYENFAAGTNDLNGFGMSILRSGSSYLTLPAITAFVSPSPTATVLALTDDSEVTVPLSAAMPVGFTGSTSALTICSNGFVSVASGNGTGFTPTIATMLNAPRTGWWCWHDMNPAAAGSGSVKFEEVGGIAYVTFDGVYDYAGTSAANANTFQFQFDLSTGNVTFHGVAFSNLGNGYLVGFSEGGNSTDPGSIDLSVVVPATFPGTFAVQPLALSLSPRPIINTPVTFTTSNITPTTPFGAVGVGLGAFPAPVDLTSAGMPGCFQYHGILATFLYLPFGASSATTNFTVPNLLGLTIQAQAYNYDPAAGLTPLGAVSSNALNLVCGDF